MQRSSNWILKLATVVMDAAMIAAAFYAAYVLRRITAYPRPLNPRPFSFYGGMMLIHVSPSPKTNWSATRHATPIINMIPLIVSRLIEDQKEGSSFTDGALS